METITIETNTEVLSTKVLLEGKTKKIVVSKYYDLDGQTISEGVDTKEFDTPKPFKIIEKKIKFNWSYGNPTIINEWEVIVNGKPFGENEYEITGYDFKTKTLKLTGCVGAG